MAPTTCGIAQSPALALPARLIEQNKSDRDAVVLEVGSRRPSEEVCDYPDIDMVSKPEAGFIHRDGRPYEKK